MAISISGAVAVRHRTIALLWASLSVCGVVFSASAQDALHIEQGRMSAHLTNATMTTVIERLQKEFGISVHVRTAVENRRVNTQFKNESLATAMRRMFAPLGVVFVHADGANTVNTLYLLSAGDAIAPTASRADDPATANAPRPLAPEVETAIKDLKELQLRDGTSDTAQQLLDAMADEAARNGAQSSGSPSR